MQIVDRTTPEGGGCRIGTVMFGPSPTPQSRFLACLSKQSGNSHSLFADFPRGLSRRLGTFCEFCAFSSLSSVHYDEQRDLGREPRRKKVLVFVTRAANVAIHIETLELFQVWRHVVRYGLDWIGLDWIC